MRIEQDVTDDFRESISRNNFDVNDFEITDEDINSTPNSDGTYYIKIKIIVTRKSNETQKIYHGGHESTWNYDFEQDLNSGLFGSP